jgi:hypothetical protein
MSTENYEQEMLNLIKQNMPQEQDTVEENIDNVENENIEIGEKSQQENNNNVDENKTESENQKQEINLNKELSGLPKELVEAVKAIKDPEDREKAIKIVKEQRVREDRLHLQLGNTKKDLENVSGLLKNLEKNPTETFKALAKRVNFDLKQAVDEPVYEDELYLTPEEQIKRETQKIQNDSYLLFKQEINQRDAREALENFLDSGNFDENFIFENQNDFITLTNKELEKIDKNYISIKDRIKAMENAYKKIEKLQPDYEDKIKAKILREINEQKKEKFDEAKKQQRISKPLANGNKPMTYEEEQMAIIRKYMG